MYFYPHFHFNDVLILKKLLVVVLMLENSISLNLDRIAGGSVMQLGKCPFFVQLEIIRNKSTVNSCGGSLITNLWIITAGHCFVRTAAEIKGSKIQKGLFEVVAHMNTYMHYRRRNTTARPIEELQFHPNFHIEMDENKTNVFYDVALAKLHEAFPKIKNIQTIEVAGVNIKKCKKGLILGSGMTKINSKKLSPYILYTVIQIGTKGLNKWLQINRNTTFFSFAAWQGGKFPPIYPPGVKRGHILEDDVGGPVVCYPRKNHPVLYGIISTYYGLIKYTPIVVTLYEQVNRHLQFIQSYAKEVQIYEGSKNETLKKQLRTEYLNRKMRGVGHVAKTQNSYLLIIFLLNVGVCKFLISVC